jgi:peptide deformylase
VEHTVAIRPVLTFPHPVLLKKTVAVTEFDEALQCLIDDMFETMYAENGLGLAANQIGSSLRLFVRDTTNDRSEPRVFINPEIIESHGDITLQEGCLSFPGVYANVSRPEFITIQAMDREGNVFTYSESGYAARCVLHEFDHLEGLTLLDRLSPTKRKWALERLQKKATK